MFIMTSLIIAAITIGCGEISKKNLEVFKEDIKESNTDLQQKAKQTSEEIKTIITED
jgi:hypothetical protein